MTDEKPKRTFRMKQPTKDELRARIAEQERIIEELQARYPGSLLSRFLSRRKPQK